MEKSEMMKKFEAETGKEAIDYLTEYPFDDYTRWLEAKAAAYDRLMSGGKKTLNEIANIFDSIVAMDESGRLHLFGMEPKINKNVGEWQPAYRSYHERVPFCDIDFTGDWKDSLTLPDGWEATNGND
jgi:hypothetical protein